MTTTQSRIEDNATPVDVTPPEPADAAPSAEAKSHSSVSQPPAYSPISLLDRLLAEQQELTAVDRFSRLHEELDQPAQAQYYSALMPATAPELGQQYAFEVDLDACSGCKACVTACHSLNGLDENETWRNVGMLHGGTTELPVLQHVTSACHHCLDPACMNVCPVNAYEKDPLTGIVKHLDDQCFGCQYCILACPYDVPKYNKSKGIVRKCDMCSDRLAVGEAPACVQSCPHQAISIKVVDKQAVIADSETNQFVPGAADPQYTLPTTNYKTSKVLPRNMLPADYYSVKPEHAHWPLVVMLVLTQLSVGAFLVELVMNSLPGSELLRELRPLHSLSALAFGLLALAASTCHLGRPQYAYRAVIGLRTSWLSREILAFSLFAALSMVYSAAVWLKAPIGGNGGTDTAQAAAGLDALALDPLGLAVVVAGLAGIGCSIMIYQCTRRVFWNGAYTSIKFLLTTLLLGIATAWLTSMLAVIGADSPEVRQRIPHDGNLLCRALIVVATVKLGFESLVFRHLRDKQNTPLKRSAMLMTGDLANPTLARFGCGFLGGVWMPGMLLLAETRPGDGSPDLFQGLVISVLFVTCLAGELLERYLFFSAVVAPKMPGGLTA